MDPILIVGELYLEARKLQDYATQLQNALNMAEQRIALLTQENEVLKANAQLREHPVE